MDTESKNPTVLFETKAGVTSKLRASSPNTPSSDSEDGNAFLPAKYAICKAEKEAKAAQEELHDLEEIKKWMTIRRAFVRSQPEIPPLSMVEKDVAELMRTIVCCNCGMIPSPQRRFLCPRGHHFCYDCGSSRFKLNDMGIGTGLCLKKAEAGENAKPIRGIGYGSIHPGMKLDGSEIEEWIKNKKTGRMECRLFLRKRRPDPLYTALFNNATWECPLKMIGCETELDGKKVHAHIVNCLGKLN